ncbi:MAG: hypothetical protein AAF351_12075 [Pseudomonadota bacterium]
MYRVLIILLSLLALSGCAVSGSLPDVSNPSAVAYIDELVDRTTANNLDKLFDTTSDGVTDGYRWYKGWWCPRHSAIESAEDVKRELASYCAAKGGAYDMKSFCRHRSEADIIIFLARITATHECSSGTTVTVEVAESATEDMNSSYVLLLRKFGYEKSVEISTRVADQLQKQDSERELAEREAITQDKSNKEEAAKILSSPNGTRICKPGDIRFSIKSGLVRNRTKEGRLVAQLDGIADDGSRIRFSVLGVEIPLLTASEEAYGSGYRMGEFIVSPGLSYWDKLFGWSICE